MPRLVASEIANDTARVEQQSATHPFEVRPGRWSAGGSPSRYIHFGCENTITENNVSIRYPHVARRRNRVEITSGRRK